METMASIGSSTGNIISHSFTISKPLISLDNGTTRGMQFDSVNPRSTHPIMHNVISTQSASGYTQRKTRSITDFFVWEGLDLNSMQLIGSPRVISQMPVVEIVLDEVNRFSIFRTLAWDTAVSAV
jgi:hypothetical protein